MCQILVMCYMMSKLPLLPMDSDLGCLEKSLRNRVLREFLVKWKFDLVEDATLEKEDDLLRDYP